MKKQLILLGLAMAFVAVTGLMWGCDKDKPVDPAPGPAGPKGDTGPALCPGCGQFKGADDCCKEGVEKCDGCKLTKGSPGCCKLTDEQKAAGKPIPVCTKCGEIKGDAKCCKAEGRETCDKCKLFKGSPGCCKIPKE